ncbi:serine hydrolase [Streptomyces sp. WMMB 322]|uniref:serine hydrolase domain-containing protein n=1 Tax=Streptomyces sp. WMMB 322 TaxID=1286821 RepID=UPI00082385B9|nr:serine hydrolase domain-containing protein [Streptomyces sp. WMMB 322]SCK10139.1 CubicO group peptidase, beta-lactamase class C family [Streptomyces sp. WMMB 322]
MKAQDAENAVDVHGTVAEGYEPLREAFAANFADRGETGAALTVHRDGQVVADLWGGRKNARPGQDDDALWQEETAAVIRSASKGPAAAVLHMLHQRGQLDLDAPVATYWPEFKSNGKERLLVRHVLAHRAGLPTLDSPLTPGQAVDGVSGPSALAAQATLWEPGTDHGYHPHTYGWLIGELVQRATGRTLGRWFAEEVANPLGLRMWFGLPATEEVPDGGVDLALLAEVPTPEQRAATGLRTRPKASVTRAYGDPASLTRRAFDAVAPRPDESDPAWLAAGLPGSGSVATARSLSRFYAALIGPVEARSVPGAHGAAGRAVGGRPYGRGTGVAGGRLFTPATLTQARSQESSGPDRVLVVNSRFGLGFMLHGPGAPMLAQGSFGHPGRGGSLAFADPESGTAFAYVTAAMQRSVTSDPRAHALVAALRACL